MLALLESMAKKHGWIQRDQICKAYYILKCLTGKRLFHKFLFFNCFTLFLKSYGNTDGGTSVKCRLPKNFTKIANIPSFSLGCFLKWLFS